MTNEILSSTENQTKLKIIIDEYIKKIKIFLHKFSNKFCAAAVSEFSDLSEIVSFLYDITVCMNFIISLICLNISNFSISDCRQFIDILIKKNSSFFFQWKKNEDAWRRNCLNYKIQKILSFYSQSECDCFFFLYFRIFISAFADEINMIFLILVDFFKFFCFSDW